MCKARDGWLNKVNLYNARARSLQEALGSRHHLLFMYALRGHKICNDEAQNPCLHHASVVTGGSCWFLNAAGRYPADHLRWKCMCGASQNSRAHITWVCEHTADLRAGLAPPTDRAEECLFSKHVPILPVALLHRLRWIEPVSSRPLRKLCIFNFVLQPTFTWQLMVEAKMGCRCTISLVIRFRDCSEDQSPFKQELNAFYFAAKGVPQAAKRQAAILAPGQRYSPTAATSFAVGIKQAWMWEPFHGKSPHFGPLLRAIALTTCALSMLALMR